MSSVCSLYDKQKIDFFYLYSYSLRIHTSCTDPSSESDSETEGENPSSEEFDTHQINDALLAR